MKDERKTRKQLIAELVEMRQRIAELEASETERQRAEEALQDNTERLLKAQRVARMGFLDWNLKTNEMIWSDQVYDLYGIDRQAEKSNIDLTMQLVHPDDKEFVEKNLEMAIKGEKEYDIDHRKLRPGGEVIWVHAQAELVRDADGNPESLLGTVVDITERKRVEEELRKHRDHLEELVEERTAELARINEQLRREITERQRAEEELKRRAAQLATLHDTSAAVASRLTPEEIFDAVVHNLSQTFGYRLVNIYLVRSVEGMLELKAHVGLPDFADARVPLEKGVVGRTARTGQPQLVTNVEEDPDFFYGAPGITSEACVPLKIEGEVLGVLNVENDEIGEPLNDSDLQLLTLLSNHIVIALENARLYEAAQRELAERKRAEEALRESEERLNEFLKSSPDPYTIWDSELNLLEASESLVYTPDGTTKEDFIGKNILEITPGIKETGRYDQYLEVMKSGKPFHCDDVVPHSQFGDLHLSVRAFKVGDGLGMIVTDITERKRAEEALRESEERLKLALEAATDGLYDWNMQTGEVYFSPRYYTMLGYKPYEMPASYDTWIDLLHPDDREYALNTVNEHVEKKRDSHEIELRLRTKSGGWRWILSRGKTIERDASGRPIRMVGTHVDITERKRAQEALRESEERYRSLFEGAEDHIFVVDQDFRYTMVNESALKAGGFTLEDIVGKEPRELFPEDAEFYLSQYRHAFETGEPVRFERELRLPDGLHWFSVTLSPVKDIQGCVTALTGISRDITERVRAEEALRESESEKKSILNAISDVVLFQDTNLTIRWGNEAAARSVGKTQQELVGYCCYELWHGRSEPCEGCPVLAALETESHAESVMATPDGRHWEVTGEPVRDGEGKIVPAGPSAMPTAGYCITRGVWRTSPSASGRRRRCKSTPSGWKTW